MLAAGTAKGWLSREAIFAIVFVVGCARAFETPTMHALLAGLVPQATGHLKAGARYLLVYQACA